MQKNSHYNIETFIIYIMHVYIVLLTLYLSWSIYNWYYLSSGLKVN